MPNMNLSEEQSRNITAYLYTLNQFRESRGEKEHRPVVRARAASQEQSLDPPVDRAGRRSRRS